MAMRAGSLMLVGLGTSLGAGVALRSGRGATLWVEGSPCPEQFQGQRGPQWRLGPGGDLQFGQGPMRGPAGRPEAIIPDPAMAPEHAVISDDGGTFYLRPHATNRDVDDQRLLVQRWEDGKWQTVAQQINQGVALLDGDQITMGQTRLVFHQGQGEPLASTRFGPLLLLLLLATALGPVTASAQGNGKARLRAADRGCLLEAPRGSGQPALRYAVNLVDRAGDPARVGLMDRRQVAAGTSVWEGNRRLRLLHVGAGGRSSRRFTMLLLDRSGTMLDPAADGNLRYEHLLQAVQVFTQDFTDGADQLALVPFESRQVVSRILSTPFHSTRRAATEAMYQLPMPQKNANTGLLSAVHAALHRLHLLRARRRARGIPDDRFLLVVLTDGKNDVGRAGDDAGLMTDAEPAQWLARRAGIEVVTIGLGPRQLVDQPTLRRLAWPSAANYFHAPSAEAVSGLFARARRFQLEQLSVTFQLPQRRRSQLVAARRFILALRLPGQGVVRGVLRWTPRPGRALPQFDCQATGQERYAEVAGGRASSWLEQYLAVLLAGLLAHLLLGLYLPRRIWARQYLEREVLELATSAVEPRSPDQR